MIHEDRRARHEADRDAIMMDAQPRGRMAILLCVSPDGLGGTVERACWNTQSLHCKPVHIEPLLLDVICNNTSQLLVSLDRLPFPAVVDATPAA
jgi:hypothetical protein